MSDDADNRTYAAGIVAYGAPFVGAVRDDTDGRVDDGEDGPDDADGHACGGRDRRFDNSADAYGYADDGEDGPNDADSHTGGQRPLLDGTAENGWEWGVRTCSRTGGVAHRGRTSRVVAYGTSAF